MFSADDTIAAIATARGAAGVAVIRISGPTAWDIARQLFSKPKTAFQPGRFYHGWLLDPWTRDGQGQPLPVDEVLLLIFKAPHSFTGDDVVEIHCHGGDFLSRRVLELCFQAGARPAQPGEFTQRAFLSGKMDLTQAESVMDLVSAQGDALVSLAGGNLKNRSLGQYMDTIRDGVLDIQAQIVASVDFPDEVDEPDRAPLVARLDQWLARVRALESAARRGRLVRDGLKVVLLGLPNSGKSSLFNALLAAERAIVTEIAGTTRDILTERLTLAGVPITLVDTAGIRELEASTQASHAAIEQMGIERSWQAAQEAMAVLYVYDATVGLRPADQEILERLDEKSRLLVANKIDCLEAPPSVWPEGTVALSARTGEGIDQVFGWLESVVRENPSEQAEMHSLSLNQRQWSCLEAVADALAQARETLGDPLLPIDLTTVPLSEALRKVDELMGRDATEAVLTSVFSQFCVGK